MLNETQTEALLLILKYFMQPTGVVPWTRVPQYDAWEYGNHRCSGHTMRECLRLGMQPAPFGPMTELVG